MNTNIKVMTPNSFKNKPNSECLKSSEECSKSEVRKPIYL